MTISIAEIEKTAESIVNNIIDHETSINLIAGMVGILPEVAVAEKALPIIAGVLQYMQGTSGKSLIQVFGDLMSHLTPGQPNSPVLAPNVGNAGGTEAS